MFSKPDYLGRKEHSYKVKRSSTSASYEQASFMNKTIVELELETCVGESPARMPRKNITCPSTGSRRFSTPSRGPFSQILGTSSQHGL